MTAFAKFKIDNPLPPAGRPESALHGRTFEVARSKFEPSRDRVLLGGIPILRGLASQAGDGHENIRCSKNERVNGFST